MLLTASSPRAPQPERGQVPLWPHQLAMLRLCADIEARVAGTDKAVAVIGDVAGAGKTFVVLALTMSRPGCTVVVVPHNIYGQWRDSIQRFAPSLRCKLIADYAAISSLYFQKDELVDGHDLLLVTSLFYSTLASTLATVGKEVARVVFDEADSIAGLLRFRLPAGMVWLVSATVHSLANGSKLTAGAYDVNLADVRSCRCEPAFVADATRLPEPEETLVVSHDAHADVLVSVMGGHDSDINTYDFACVSTAVSTAKEALETLTVGCVAEIKDCTEALEALLDTPEIDTKEYEKRLASANARLEAVRRRMSEAEMCPICYEPLDGDVAVAKCCANPFCESCVRGWVKVNPKCPLCRAALKVVCMRKQSSLPVSVRPADDKVQPAGGQYHTRRELDKVQNALLVIAGRLEESPDARFIVFSDSGGILTRIARGLAVGSGALDGGSAKAIEKGANAFRSGETRVLMADSSLFGCGMDFPFVTDVLIMHDLSADMTHQVIGRAQRPGRTSRLRVFKFLHDNELHA